jgi:LAGLIDADG DNA endonuclease family protein
MKIMNNPNIKNPSYLYFLGGFFEGEGSNSVSISIHPKFKYGVNVQPVFNVTQHVNGLDILKSFKDLFNGGSLVLKSGSSDVYVFSIKGYKQILERVIPFLEIYVQPFSCKRDEYSVFKQICILSSEGKQKDKDSLIEIVKLAYLYQGKGKGRKRGLQEVLEIIQNKELYFNSLKDR